MPVQPGTRPVSTMERSIRIVALASEAVYGVSARVMISASAGEALNKTLIANHGKAFMTSLRSESTTSQPGGYSGPVRSVAGEARRLGQSVYSTGALFAVRSPPLPLEGVRELALPQ